MKSSIFGKVFRRRRVSPAKEKIASHSFLPKDFSRTVGKGTERICELAKDIFECLQTSKDQPKVLFQRIDHLFYQLNIKNIGVR